MADFEELLSKAEQISDAVKPGENTATRVGGLFEEIVNELEIQSKEYADLSKRLVGTSVNSNPSTDPFKLIGNASSIEQVNSMLDELHSTKASDKKCGSFRILFGDSPIFVENSVLYYVNDEWTQCVRGRLDLSENKKELILGRDFNIIWRRHTSLTGWSAWSLISGKNSYHYSANYGKKVQVFGGSLSCLIESETAKNLWRNILGMRVESLGHGGAGYGSGGSQIKLLPHAFVENTLPKVTDLSNIPNGGVLNNVQNQVRYLSSPDTDIFILWLSTNDYTMNLEPGSWKDYTIHDGFNEENRRTQCGGLNFCIKYLRERVNPKARIYAFTPLRFFYDRQDADGGYNVNSLTHNITGSSFYDYIKSAVETCAYQGVPVLDQFSLQGVGWEQREIYYKKEPTTSNNNPWQFFHMNEKGYEMIGHLQVEFLANGYGTRVYDIEKGDDSDLLYKLQESMSVLSNEVTNLKEAVKNLTGENDRPDRVYTRDLGNYDTFDEILSVLNTMHSTSFDDNKVGHFVIALQGRPFYVNNIPLYILGDHYMQVFEGAVALSVDNKPYPTTEYNILVRSHIENEWSLWKKYINELTIN